MVSRAWRYRLALNRVHTGWPYLRARGGAGQGHAAWSGASAGRRMKRAWGGMLRALLCSPAVDPDRAVQTQGPHAAPRSPATSRFVSGTEG